MTYQITNQRYERDCGIATVSTVTQTPWEQVYKIWPGGFQGDISDSYIHHQEVLRRLNFAWERLTADQILNGAGTPGRTALLLNANNDPDTWQREDWTNLHWCVFAGRDVANKKVKAHWLDGTDKEFSYDAFREHFKNMFCVAYTAYALARIEKLPWYKRLYIRVTSWFNRELY